MKSKKILITIQNKITGDNMEQSIEEKIVNGLNQVISGDPSESAFVEITLDSSEEDINNYNKHARLIIEPDTCGAKISEEALDEYHELLDNNKPAFVEFIRHNISPKWGEFAELVIKNGY